MKRHLSLVLAGSLFASFAIVACAQDSTSEPFEPAETLAGEDSGSTILPPPSNNTDSGPSVDSGKKDSGKDGATDAAKDSGPPPPKPGEACKTVDALATRSCGMCGKQEAICVSADGGLAWSDYGPCNGEAGECLPGTTRPCGNCGTQTCSTFCGWGSCGGQPANSCSPGSVSFTTAGCPGGGFRSRTCGAACSWAGYSMVCESPKAVDLWSTGPGAYSTFMRGDNGKVYAWGLDEDGQLGDSEVTNKGKMVPTPFTNVSSIAIGGGTTYGFSLAAFGDGSGKCWGYNSSSYTLGDGVTSTSATGIVPTGFGTNLVSVGAGYAHGCGLFSDGTAKCFGYNTYGQLGNGNTTTQKEPVAVSGLTGITGLYSGYYTVCAKKGDAGYCWGYNTYGQVGDNSTTSRSAPVLVFASGVASFAPSYYHTCAAMTDGTAMCWGENDDGEGGNGVTSAKNQVPVAVVGIDGVGAKLTGVAEVCTGYAHSCARLTDGRVACWGYNSTGQLGLGNTSSSSVPKAVPGITASTKLVCGYQHTCAIDGDKVKCWGDNAYGQLGNGGMPNDALSPVNTTF